MHGHVHRYVHKHVHGHVHARAHGRARIARADEEDVVGADIAVLILILYHSYITLLYTAIIMRTAPEQTNRMWSVLTLPYLVEIVEPSISGRRSRCMHTSTYARLEGHGHCILDWKDTGTTY